MQFIRFRRQTILYMGLTKDAWDRALFPEGEEEGKGVKSFLDRAKEGAEDEEAGGGEGIMALALRGDHNTHGRSGFGAAWDIVLAGEPERPAKGNQDDEESPEEHPHSRSLLQRTVGSGLQGFAEGMGLPTDTAGAFHGIGHLLGGATMAVLVDDTRAAVAREAAANEVKTKNAATLEEAKQKREEQRILFQAEKTGRKRVQAQEREKKKKEKAKQPPSRTRVAIAQFGDDLRDHADGLGRDIMTGLSGWASRGLDAIRRTARNWQGKDDDTAPVSTVEVIQPEKQEKS